MGTYLVASSFKADTLVILTPKESQKCEVKIPPSNSNITYTIDRNDNIETLSTKGQDTGVYNAFLYVPWFGDSCQSELENIVPPNVTRHFNLPADTCRTAALIPWVSDSCTRSLLTRATTDRVSAAVIYLPDDSTSKPPPASHHTWRIDGSDAWRFEYEFPVFAIPGASGQELMKTLPQYSEELADLKPDYTLPPDFPSDSWPRLFVTIVMDREENNNAMPSLWVFLLAVLGILIGIVVTSSVTMRLVQRHRRRSLQNRVNAGQVDLEMLGIKRLSVPQHILDDMPQYTYSADGHPMALAPTQTPSSDDSQTSASKQAQGTVLSTIRNMVSNVFSRNNATVSQPSAGPSTASRGQGAEAQTLPSGSSNEEPGQLTFSQSTCPICLEDYVPGECIVRELPCRHIFHPGCIDTFLLQNSSLCPVCKLSVLPRGYFPEKITDTMVRQERFARAVQRHRSSRHRDSIQLLPMLRRPAPSYSAAGLDRSESRPQSNIRHSIRSHFRVSVSHPEQPHAIASPEANPSRPAEQDVGANDPNRREEMRQRAMAMLGNETLVEDLDRERASARPKCKLYSSRCLLNPAKLTSNAIGLKIVHKLFPGFR
ncbi:hypothetical protein FQN57_005388 [Myotisia sp. PD_48]|nr:hypothetical protein FQN57_005388 [Myotisia sp. PD_48]